MAKSEYFGIEVLKSSDENLNVDLISNLESETQYSNLRIKKIKNLTMYVHNCHLSSHHLFCHQLQLDKLKFHHLSFGFEIQ